MSVFSNQLFISPERPVDPFTLSILELIDRLLRDAKIRYMLVGATARDLLLYHVFGHAVSRLRGCGAIAWFLAREQDITDCVLIGSK